MATYTVIGHPIGAGAQTTLPEALRDLLQSNGVGATITIVLSGPDDTDAKDQGVIR
jgi:hypothetical protein